MDYKELQSANSGLKTTNIKGKEYVPVSERIRAFRMLYPDGYIRSEIVHMEEGMVVIRATVGRFDPLTEQDVILATGTAYEKEASSNINRTSYIENCETSAVGRALGFAGFGIDTSVASAEEIVQADLAEASLALIDKRKAAALERRMETEGIDIPKLLSRYSVYEVAELNEQQHSHIINNWETILKKFKLRTDL